MAQPGEDMQATGSSPLTRGKLTAATGQTQDTRLIPAHAGKTNQVLGRYGSVWAHPRSRGENSARAALR